MAVVDKFDLSSDPCDYRLIRINNCLQVLSIFCHCFAICFEDLRRAACIIDRLADLFYAIVSGCMTAQVSLEMDYQSRPLPSIEKIPSYGGTENIPKKYEPPIMQDDDL